MAEDQWNETEHELARRLTIMESSGRLTSDAKRSLEEVLHTLIDAQAIEVIPRSLYASFEKGARRRIPRDPQDWPTVALALLLDAPILKGDHDFLGCGCPTWTVETLTRELEALEKQL